MLQFADPVAGSAHVPRLAPLAIVHDPLQQSVFAAHTSPVCTQNEDAEHTPPEQSPEQQSASAVHAFASVLHVVSSGVHVPIVQVPEQQSPPLVHAPSSLVHMGRLQTFPAHVPEQQSIAIVHAAPMGEQLVPLPVVRPLPVLAVPVVPVVPVVIAVPTVPAAPPPLFAPPLPPMPRAPPDPLLDPPQPHANSAAGAPTRRTATANRTARCMGPLSHVKSATGKASRGTDGRRPPDARQVGRCGAACRAAHEFAPCRMR